MTFYLQPGSAHSNVRVCRGRNKTEKSAAAACCMVVFTSLLADRTMYILGRPADGEGTGGREVLV